MKFEYIAMENILHLKYTKVIMKSTFDDPVKRQNTPNAPEKRKWKWKEKVGQVGKKEAGLLSRI